MKKFMILYLTTLTAEQQMKMSPEERKKFGAPWIEWYKKNGKAIVDQGAPLGNGVCMDKRGSTKAQTQITGYTIVQAKDMEAVKAMVANHPHFMFPKASIEVYELLMQM